MRWLLNFVTNLLRTRRNALQRRRLMGMYLDESNAHGRRKPNRERA